MTDEVKGQSRGHISNYQVLVRIHKREKVQGDYDARERAGFFPAGEDAGSGLQLPIMRVSFRACWLGGGLAICPWPGGARYYRVTPKGQQIMTAALKLREADIAKLAA